MKYNFTRAPRMKAAIWNTYVSDISPVRSAPEQRCVKFEVTRSELFSLHFIVFILRIRPSLEKKNFSLFSWKSFCYCFITERKFRNYRSVIAVQIRKATSRKLWSVYRLLRITTKKFTKSTTSTSIRIRFEPLQRVTKR